MKPAASPPFLTNHQSGFLGCAQGHSLEDAAFLSGAALSHLSLTLARAEVPLAVLRDRLALTAAEACAGFAGRCARAAELRDAVHLTRAGDQVGPLGEILQTWRGAAARKMSQPNLARLFPRLSAERIGDYIDRHEVSPIARAAGVLEAVLQDQPRADMTALIFADAALARALGWDHLLPLLAAGMASRDLRKSGHDLRLACHKAAMSSARAAVQMAGDLAERGDRLRAVAAKLRAKGAGEAAELFLCRDAISPAALALEVTGLNSDRAARRLCDRLVDLGVLRELTGRATFRLYGL